MIPAPIFCLYEWDSSDMLSQRTVLSSFSSRGDQALTMQKKDNDALEHDFR